MQPERNSTDKMATLERNDQKLPSGSPYSVPPPGFYYPAIRQPARRRAGPLVIGLTLLFGAALAVGLFGLITYSWFGGTFGFEQRQLQTETQAIPVGQAQSAQVEISMGVGNMTVSGGASDLLNANFTYDLPSWKPRLSSSTTGPVARLSVSQPNGSTFMMSRYDWDLRLNNNIPLDLSVKNSVGKSDLNLQGLNLTRLTVNNDVGNTNVNLAGIQPQSLNVAVENGVGNVSLTVPRSVGVIVYTDNGLGKINANNLRVNGNTYTNEAYGSSAATITINLKNGVGNINLYQS